MLNFVTLFDKNYMSRGIVLYNSLKEHCKQDFTFYVLAMDEVTEKYLKSLGKIAKGSLIDPKHPRIRYLK